MKNNWNVLKFGMMLLMLPLVATAAASAHLHMAEASAITIGTEPVAVAKVTVGLDRVHTVALNRNGGVDGRIVSFDANANVQGLANSNVQFIQNGKVAAQGTTDASGEFAVQNLPEGVYSFIASGDNGFAAYSVRVISDSTGAYSDVMEAVAVTRVDSVKQIISVKTGNSQPADIQISMDEKGANRIALKDGVLAGRVLSPGHSQIVDTHVHILQDGVSIAKVKVNEQGQFEVADMKPGVYDFAAVGPQGYAVVGFEAIDFERQVSKPAGTITYVSTGPQDGEPIYTDVLNVYMVQPQDQGFVEQPVYDDGAYLPIEYGTESFAYGGATGQAYYAPSGGGGGFGGGGGGGGFGGGGGRLLPIAALAIGIIALTDNGGSNPPDSSPSTR